MPGITGPAPKPDSERRRRNATVAMTKLPAEGRTKRAPNWPLIPDVVLTARRDVAAAKVEALQERLFELQEAGKPTGALDRKLDTAREHLAVVTAQLREARKLEAVVWRDLWRTPQAVQWERLGWIRDVAQYVRHKVLAELGDLNSAKEARQWSDRLGLTPLSMLRLRWEVVHDETAARRESNAAAAAAAGPVSPQQRLRVVDTGAVAG